MWYFLIYSLNNKFKVWENWRKEIENYGIEPDCDDKSLRVNNVFIKGGIEGGLLLWDSYVTFRGVGLSMNKTLCLLKGWSVFWAKNFFKTIP